MLYILYGSTDISIIKKNFDIDRYEIGHKIYEILNILEPLDIVSLYGVINKYNRHVALYIGNNLFLFWSLSSARLYLLNAQQLHDVFQGLYNITLFRKRSRKMEALLMDTILVLKVRLHHIRILNKE